MKPLFYSLLATLALPAAVRAQDYAELWLLGLENGNQTEFSQEQGMNAAPGSASAQDDDYYFAGTYPDPIGTVATDEALANYDRALVPGDPFNRIHFNLDTVASDPGTQFRFTTQLCCFGAADNGESSHDLTIRFNGNDIFSQEGIDGDMLVDAEFLAGDVNAVEGANVIEIERTNGSASAWVQFDYHRLEIAAADADQDGMPDTYENQYAFLDPQNASDAALDEDGDGLTNLEEYLARSQPDNSDTDGDTLSDGDEVKVHQTSPRAADSDNDGLDDAAEINQYASNPNLPDTDGDTLSDGDEVNVHGTNPTLADSDADGVDDATEIELGTDPNDPKDIPVLYSGLWQLGVIDGGQGEFSQETGASPPPGSPAEQDDDYYFAGTYAEVGAVAEDEVLANFDRALTDGDPVNRIHFNLDDIAASEGAEYRVTVQLCCLGPAGASTHDVVMRLNGKEFFSQTGIASDLLVRATVSGADAQTKVGENVLEIEKTGGEGWIQFDYLTMEFRSDDTDRDRMPNSYEAKYPFLNPADPADAALDQDDDGLTNLEEFENNTEPDVADTDSDGLSDGDEVKVHGSKPRVADTDGDGLLDGDEVNTYKTNVLDPDTDDDGLNDGAEIAAGSNPFEKDSDGDGENDNDEVLYGSDPADPNSKPLPYELLWQIGDDNDTQSEFTQETGGIQPAPGSHETLDDDYYLAGQYPDTVGSVAVDEDWSNFERALTSGDPFSRIHFNLGEDLVNDTTQMRVHIEFVQLGAAAGIQPVHDVVVRVNGTDIFSQTGIEEDTNIDASFLPTQVNAVAGPNTIEIERTGQSASSWIQFDLIRLEQRAILTDDPNLLVQSRNIFGELQGLGRVTRALKITNTGQQNELVISNVAITGPDAAHFSVADVPDTIGPRQDATFTVTFDPMGQGGGFAAFLEFTSNDSGDEKVLADLSARISDGTGLLAHYPLDETEGILALDVSGGGRHGEFQTTGEGVLQLGQPPLAAGQAVSLTHGATGAAFVAVTDTFNPLVDASLSLWFQAEDDPGVLTLISKNLGADSQGDPFTVAYNQGTVFVFVGGEPVAEVSGVAAGEPHHLVVSFENASDPRAITLYVDGAEAQRITQINGFEDEGNSPLVIGAMNGSFGFQGIIDDVQIYGRALSPEDVSFLRDNPGQSLPGETVVDPNADDDGDGQPNTLELRAGTDPNDPTSFFRLNDPQRTAEGVALSWASASGIEYILEYSATLQDDWVEVETVTAAGATAQFVDTDAARTGGATGFYRLRLP